MATERSGAATTLSSRKNVTSGRIRSASLGLWSSMLKGPRTVPKTPTTASTTAWCSAGTSVLPVMGATRGMTGSFLRCVQVHDRVEPRLVPDHASDVAAAGQVFGQHDVAGADAHDGAVAHFDLGGAGERDRVLPARRAMPVEHVAGRRPAKSDATGRLQRRAPPRPPLRIRRPPSRQPPPR